MRQWALVNLAVHQVVRDRRGKFILRESKSHPRDLPAGFDAKHGFVFEEVVGTVTDRNHHGAPIYTMPDPNVARVLKIVGKP